MVTTYLKIKIQENASLVQLKGAYNAIHTINVEHVMKNNIISWIEALSNVFLMIANHLVLLVDLIISLLVQNAKEVYMLIKINAIYGVQDKDIMKIMKMGCVLNVKKAA